MNSTPASSRARRFNSSLAKALLAGRWIDSALRLIRLFYLLKSSAIARGANDFHGQLWFRSFHKISFLKTSDQTFIGTRSICPISLCRTEFVCPLSHFIVTPVQSTALTLPRSVALAFQQTRSPTLRSRDWSPVIGCSIRRPQSPHRKLDLSIWQLPPMFNNRN
jgi:hypothetical protein